MLIVANWKAYVEELKKAKELVVLSKRLARTKKVSIVLAPPATFLGILAATNASKVEFAAQDISATTGGAQTGEIVAQTFGSIGTSYAIIGHSERRATGDSNEIVAEKLAHALAHNLTPILCIGEQARDTEGQYLAQIREQLSTAFTPFTLKERSKIIVAYEPVWAIGKTAAQAIHTDDLREMVLYIRKVLGEFLPGKGSSRTTILYGGSVEASGARSLAVGTGVDGFLVGHASADKTSFANLVKELT